MYKNTDTQISQTYKCTNDGLRGRRLYLFRNSAALWHAFAREHRCSVAGGATSERDDARLSQAVQQAFASKHRRSVASIETSEAMLTSQVVRQASVNKHRCSVASDDV